MIYKNSHDPVYIKKINLKVWSVRDEIEEVIKHRLEQVPPEELAKHKSKEQLKNLIHLEELDQEYNNSKKSASPIPLNATAGAIDPLEAEMLNAMGGGKTDANPPPADPLEAEMQKAMQAGGGEGPAGAPQPAPETASDAAPAADTTSTPEVASAPETQAAATSTETTPSPAVQEQKVLTPGIVEDGNVISIVQRHPHIDESHLALGRLILSEISSEQIYIFVDKKFIEGQNIRIEFLIPRHFIISAQVKYCRKFSMKSKVIRETRLVYRLVAKFTFERPGERTLLRQFLKSIGPDLAAHKKAAAKPAAQAGGGGGGGGELDDLDL